VTQGIEQLAKEDAHAVFANVATIATFRVSGDDAERLETQFARAIPAKVLQELPDFKVYVRTMTTDPNGISRPTGPHPVDCFPPDLWMTKGMTSRDRVLRTSLERHTRPRADVATRLGKFLSN
jgi:hypothetical protein